MNIWNLKLHKKPLHSAPSLSLERVTHDGRESRWMPHEKCDTSVPGYLISNFFLCMSSRFEHNLENRNNGSKMLENKNEPFWFAFTRENHDFDLI